MLTPVVIFVLVFGIVFGAVYLAVLRPEDEERNRLRRRLSHRAATAAARHASFLKRTDEVTAVPTLDRLLAPLQRVVAPLNTKLSHADMKMTAGALLVLATLAVVVVYVVTYALTGYAWAAVVAAALAGWVPFLVVSFKASQRIRTFEEQFPEAIDLISRALRAGHAFTTALQMVADEAPRPVAGEFRTLYDAQNFGLPLPDALADFAARIPLLDAKFFVTAVMTQRESGGNLSEVLDNLARVIRERFKVKRQIRVISAHGKLTAVVLSATPPFLALAFMVIRPNHLDALTNEPMGWMLIAAAITLQVTGMLIIRKLVNIEY